ncbi:MAG: UvrB/UvrC motif-containing protein [Candidatus Omnitrophica bacterium]|nr:UvrB/UvrC motif-containing protein [Candidatus Omnitrophota bacterium]
MLCDICHKNIATVHLTEIINDKVAEMHICQACAQNKSEGLAQQPNISDFVGGLVNADLTKKDNRALKCPACGFNYNDFKKKGRLGCGRCYTAFRRQLLPLLKKIHGAIRHTGKIPLDVKRPVSSEVKLRELNDQLERAIQLEEYEAAAKIRDKLKKLDKNK